MWSLSRLTRGDWMEDFCFFGVFNNSTKTFKTRLPYMSSDHLMKPLYDLKLEAPVTYEANFRHKTIVQVCWFHNERNIKSRLSKSSSVFSTCMTPLFFNPDIFIFIEFLEFLWVSVPDLFLWGDRKSYINIRCNWPANFHPHIQDFRKWSGVHCLSERS